MKTYKKVQPEVIVGLGGNTTFLEKDVPYLTVTNLHIELEGWLGDDLMECSVCYVVTEQLKKYLEDSGFTGFYFAPLERTKGVDFIDNYKLGIELPDFYWIQIIGKKDIDDMYLTTDNRLYISAPLLKKIQSNFNTRYLDVE